MKIGVVGHIRPAAMARLQAIPSAEIVSVADGSPDEISPAVDDVDALLLRTSKVTPELLDRAPRLKAVSRHGVGYDNVPLSYLNGRRIPLAISATANMISVAEHTLTMMLCLAKQVLLADYAVRHNEWNSRNRLELFELAGKTLLIVGFGRIGSEVARRALAFDMRVAVFDPMVGDDPIENAGCVRAPVLETAVTEADIVTLHCPANADTQNLFDQEMLARMKVGSMLLNTARGGLIDETALAQALRQGPLAAAGLDVMNREPPEAGDPLFALDNLLLSPHVAGVTTQAMERMGLEAAQNIADILSGKLDPAVIVNWSAVGAAS